MVVGHRRPPGRHARHPPAPAAARTAGRRRRSSPSSARRRWPACRCCSASSPRRRPTPRSPTARSRRQRLVLAGIVVGSTLTVAYSARFLWGLTSPADCAGPSGPHPDRRADVRPPPPSPRVVRRSRRRRSALLSVVTGVAPALLDRLVAAATLALDPGSDPEHLALWHGVQRGPRPHRRDVRRRRACCSSPAARSPGCSPSAR